MLVRSCFIVMLFTALLGACTMSQPYLDTAASDQIPPRPEITESLFDSKDRTISEADIQRMLDGRIRLPDTVRLAVYRFGGTSTKRYYSMQWNKEEYLKTQQSFLDTLVTELMPLPRVEDVFLVPDMLTRERPNITQLREAAVRLQADLLLVFAVHSDIYYKYKTFQKNKSKAFATCEAILLDTRTGVIPHSSVVTRDSLVVKEKEDWTNEELRKRAENAAISLSLVETGRRVADFLER